MAEEQNKHVVYDEEGNITNEYCYKNGEKVDMSLCE